MFLRHRRERSRRNHFDFFSAGVGGQSRSGSRAEGGGAAMEGAPEAAETLAQALARADAEARERRRERTPAPGSQAGGVLRLSPPNSSSLSPGFLLRTSPRALFREVAPGRTRRLPGTRESPGPPPPRRHAPRGLRAELLPPRPRPPRPGPRPPRGSELEEPVQRYRGTSALYVFRPHAMGGWAPPPAARGGRNLFGECLAGKKSPASSCGGPAWPPRRAPGVSGKNIVIVYR